MSSGKSFYVVGPDKDVRRLVKERGANLAETEEDADAVIFTGGGDISPFLYGEKRHQTTFPHFERDLFEVRIAKSLDITKPKIGICRGAQLLNVLSGGSMYQNVNNHQIRGKHDVKDLFTGELVGVSSIHHQMMIPQSNAILVAVAKEATVKQTATQHISYQVNDWDDPEVVFYPFNKSLCFQGHPEYVDKNDPCRDYFWQLVDRYCFPT